MSVRLVLLDCVSEYAQLLGRLEQFGGGDVAEVGTVEEHLGIGASDCRNDLGIGVRSVDLRRALRGQGRATSSEQGRRLALVRPRPGDPAFVRGLRGLGRGPLRRLVARVS